MKKLILLGVVAVVAVLLAVYGRDGLDLYRLISHVEASSAASEADGGPWPRLTDACIGCHGVQGHSQHQGYPTLAGQPAPYLAAQLKRFASGERANPNMGPLAISLSEAEIEQLSEYFAKQSPVANRSFKPDPRCANGAKNWRRTAAAPPVMAKACWAMSSSRAWRGRGTTYLLAQLDALPRGGARTRPAR